MSMFYSKEKRIWFEKNYVPNSLFHEDRTIITNHGISVRSKSEQIIGNALEAKGIKYHYEEKFEADDHNRYPDFTIQQPSTGNLIYWEHFGLTNKIDYIESMMKKLGFYIENDLLPWDNLICTYEKDTKDSRRINRIIEMVIL